MSTRHTLVVTSDLHSEILAGARAVTARPVASANGVLLIAQRLGYKPQPGEVVVPLGVDGLTCTSNTIAGHLPGPSGPVPAGGVRIAGPSWPLVLPDDHEPGDDVYDRQIRAFGVDGQRLLRNLRVGVVGAGGTGSAVVEQLVRLGVRDIVVIDPDTINDDGSNVTRVYGSTMTDRGEAKVALAERNADRIGLGTALTPVPGSINDEATARLLTSRDVIFGCTDDNRGRVTLGRLATWYLIPVIDMGVKLTSSNGRLRGIEGASPLSSQAAAVSSAAAASSPQHSRPRSSPPTSERTASPRATSSASVRQTPPSSPSRPESRPTPSPNCFNECSPSTTTLPPANSSSGSMTATSDATHVRALQATGA